MSALLAKITREKRVRRLRLVLANSLNQIVLILFSPLLSLIVIRSTSLELWGAFVEVLIVVQLGAHIAGWGNKEYLLREFSRNPAGLRTTWQQAFSTRLPLLLLLLLVLAVIYPSGYWPYLLLWAVGLFLAQSFDVFIVYRRDFVFAALVEFAALAILVSVVFFQRQTLGVSALLAAFGLVYGLKGLIYAGRYRHDALSGRLLSHLWQRFTFPFLSAALPFFLLTFSGMLKSRIDLYAVNFFLSPREVAEYQVFINFILYVQAAAGFILLPFVKSIYRLNFSVILKIAMRLFLTGLLIVPLAMPVIYGGLLWIYGIELSIPYFLWGALYALPIYFFLPFIYTLFKMEKQTYVIVVNLVGVLLNLILDIILLPQMGSAGAILAAAVVAWLTLIFYSAFVLFPRFRVGIISEVPDQGN